MVSLKNGSFKSSVSISFLNGPDPFGYNVQGNKVRDRLTKDVIEEQIKETSRKPHGGLRLLECGEVPPNNQHYAASMYLYVLAGTFVSMEI